MDTYGVRVDLPMNYIDPLYIHTYISTHAYTISKLR